MASKDEGAPALPAVSSAEGSAAAENHPAESGQAQSNPVVEVEPLAQVTSWKDFDPQVEFDKAYRLVRPPVGAIVADPKMSVIYNHTEKELEKLVVCRKEHPSGLYEYHISGIFPVSAKTVFEAQSDLAYRQTWDEYMKSFEVLAAEGNMEFIRWVVAFPWPFHAREYILRRWKGYNKNADGGACYAFVGKIFEDDLKEVPRSTKKHTLVEQWETLQVYQAHSENSCKFYIKTFADPKMRIPKTIINWFAKTGIPKFQQKNGRERTPACRLRCTPSGFAR
eukprot:INCI16686.2.p1 GENE.INCI16686.2~~INCI16686.2.p1  ORF type:complete len:280 (+),score=42.56 INCI16686.2:168-1007(+)